MIKEELMDRIKGILSDSKRLKIIISCTIILLLVTGFAVGIFARSSDVGIIGGADGPTRIILSESGNSRLADWLIKIFGAKGEVEEKVKEETENPPAYTRASKADVKEAFEKGLLILINKQNPVAKDYKPEDLAPIKYYAEDRSEAGRYMRKEAADHFHKLVEGAASAGHEILMTTAYRSYGFQEVLWNNYVAREGEAEASRFSARPGTSEHQSGLAVDVSSPSVNYTLTEEYGESKEGVWLAENAHLYGFIIRFPKEKEEITGYLYEPWHIRYVGVPIATEIYERNITLEEYLE